MQKARRALAQIAGRFLFIGISVQIVLGICWMIRAYDIFPEFGDSYLWLKAADTLVCDDYMGIGYPLFLMLAKGIESISSIPYPFFVYTVQILFAFYSGVMWRCCRILRDFLSCYWNCRCLLESCVRMRTAYRKNSLSDRCLQPESGGRLAQCLSWRTCGLACCRLRWYGFCI